MMLTFFHHSQDGYRTIGSEENDRDTINPQPGNESLPDHLNDVPRNHEDYHPPWCDVYGPSMKKQGRQRLLCMALKMFRFSWSFNVVFLVTLLTSLIIIGLSLWLANYYVIRRGVEQAAKIQRDELTSRVLTHVRDFVSTGPFVVQAIIKTMESGDRSGFNFSDSRNEKSRKLQEVLMLSQLENPKITTLWYGTHYNYFTGMLINDTSTPRQRFILGLSNGDGALNEYSMNTALDVATTISMTHFGYIPTQRPWYLAAKETGATLWGKILFTVTQPPHLTVAVTGPYFDVNDRSLYGAVSAGINLQTLSDFLGSLVIFPETRLYVLQRDMTLVAVNKGKITNDTDPQNPQMVDARNSTDFVIRESANVIDQALGVPLPVDDSKYVGFHFVDSTGEKRQVSIIGFEDNFGLSWNIVSVISESVVLKVVNKSNQVLATVTVCTIIGTLLIALIISIIISVPLYEIAREFARITKMNFRNQTRKIHSLPIFEIAVMTESIRQLKNGLQLFDAYVPSDVVKVLMSRNASARLGVVRRRMTILFIDTRFENTNNLSPNLLVEMLQIMFTSFAQIVTDEGGVVDKYLSEGMMCLFNAPLSIDDHELRSIRACIKIHESVHELNREWISKGHPNISIQIGVNTDQCFIGNVGSRSRVNYTALGDAVNVASRLTSINKQYHTSIMIGPKTKEAVQDYFVCRWISFVCVKGKSQPLHVFEVLSEREKASDKQKELESLTSQVKQLIEENNINSALSLVLKLLLDYPRDKALIELRTRLESPNFCPYVEVGRKV